MKDSTLILLLGGAAIYLATKKPPPPPPPPKPDLGQEFVDVGTTIVGALGKAFAL